jgi:hypothetical protein
MNLAVLFLIFNIFYLFKIMLSRNPGETVYTAHVLLAGALFYIILDTLKITPVFSRKIIINIRSSVPVSEVQGPVS